MGIIARTRQKRTHQVAATQTLARHASVDGERQRERAERQAFPASFRIALPIIGAPSGFGAVNHITIRCLDRLGQFGD